LRVSRDLHRDKSDNDILEFTNPPKMIVHQLEFVLRNQGDVIFLGFRIAVAVEEPQAERIFSPVIVLD